MENFLYGGFAMLIVHAPFSNFFMGIKKDCNLLRYYATYRMNREKLLQEQSFGSLFAGIN